MNFFQFAENSPITAVFICLVFGCTLVGIAEAIGKGLRKR